MAQNAALQAGPRGDLNMNDDKVVYLLDPTSDGDAVNKRYFTEHLNVVDEKIKQIMISTQNDSRTLSTTCLIPHHIGLIDATGFIVTTSSNHGSNHTGHQSSIRQTRVVGGSPVMCI